MITIMRRPDLAMNTNHPLWISLAFSSALSSFLSAQSRPAVEYSTLLDSVRVTSLGPAADQGGKLIFSAPRGIEMQAAFLPKPDRWDPTEMERSGGHRMWAKLEKGGAEKAKFTFIKYPIEGVFSRFRTRAMSSVMSDAGFQNDYRFTEAGDYLLTIMVDKEAVTRLPFRVRFGQIGDEFDGRKTTIVDGPWNDWAYISIGMGKANAVVSFEAYLRREPTGGNQQPDRYTVDILQDGDVVAVASAQSVVAHPEWNRHSFQITYPKGQGSGAYGSQILLRKDGEYHVVLEKNGAAYGLYKFVANSGKIVPHARQSSSYQPRLDYLLPRRWGTPTGNLMLHWMQRITGAQAAAIANAKPTAVTGPDTSTKAAWIVKPSTPANTPFKIVVTPAKLRPDTAIAAGDGIIAYGTGGFTGVEYLKIGEDKPTSIPKGQDFLAKMIGVCGKKITLFHKNKTCAIFDTSSGKLHEIPATDLLFSRLAGGPYRANHYATSGYLLATINDQSRVTDRTTIKVVDVSGPTPRIINIKNAGDLQARQCSSIAVDAATGKVAISSKGNNAIYVADVAPRAIPKKIDLTGHDGVRDAPIHVAGGYVFYQDASGSSKVRLIEIESGKVFTPSLNPVPGRPSGRSLVAGKYVYTLKEGRGSNYHIAIGTPGVEAKKAANAGQAGPQRTTELGTGGSVAIAGDGSVFLAGQGAVGSGMYLQCLGSSGWVLVGPGGKPLPASDVVAGPGVVAFKTGKSRNLAVGYAVFGAKVDVGGFVVK